MEELRVEILRVLDSKNIGHFYIPADADEHWLKRILPALFHGMQVLAQESIKGSSEAEEMKVERTERGWAGHFIGARYCRFRRNTLLRYGDTEIVVSTVGLMESADGKGFEEIGCNRHYETMAFYANPTDTRYHDIDLAREVHFDSPWCISELDADDKANDMHERVVSEIYDKLEHGGIDKHQEV